MLTRFKLQQKTWCARNIRKILKLFMKNWNLYCSYRGVVCLFSWLKLYSTRRWRLTGGSSCVSRSCARASWHSRRWRCQSSRPGVTCCVAGCAGGEPNRPSMSRYLTTSPVKVTAITCFLMSRYLTTSPVKVTAIACFLFAGRKRKWPLTRINLFRYSNDDEN